MTTTTTYHLIPSSPPSHDFEVECVQCHSDWSFHYDPSHYLTTTEGYEDSSNEEESSDDQQDATGAYCLQCKHFVEEYKTKAEKKAAAQAKKAQKKAAKAAKKACGKCVKCPKCKACCPKCKCKMCSPKQYAYKFGGFLFLGFILLFLGIAMFILVYTLIFDGPADLVVRDLEHRILNSLLPTMDKSARARLSVPPPPRPAAPVATSTPSPAPADGKGL